MDQVRVLLVEDDEDDYLVTRHLLTAIYSTRLVLDWVRTYELALEAMAHSRHDVCLMDYRLGAHNGLELLRQACANNYPAPIILMTGQGDREVDIEAMKAGAADYLVKGQIDSALLERAVRYAIQQKRSEAERLQLIREQLLRARAEDANRLKDEFLAVVSHELKTPLNAINGWAEMLRMGRLSEQQSRQAIETIARNAKIQKQIIDDLLDVSRIITGKMRLNIREISVPEVIRAAAETVRHSAEAKHIQLKISTDPAASKIMGDFDRLQQIVWNLLANAIKFTPQGGQVSVMTARVKEQIEIIVSDTGSGIKAEFLPYVFDRFRQEDATTKRKAGGLGLGLAIVRQLAELHGGTARVESAGQGQGATFVITLPLHHVPEKESPVIAPAEQANLAVVDDELIGRIRGLRILVVDDEPDAIALIQLILERGGAEVRTANCAADGQRLLDEWPPDLIVSDIGMAGTDGYEFMVGVRARSRERGGLLPAVALTAYSRTEDRIRALEAGYQMHVPKPVEPEELLTVIASLTGRV